MSYRATPEQWAQVEQFDEECCYAACLLELRYRIEQIEAAANLRQQDEDAERAMEPAPAGGLVERVADALDGGTESQARAAILAVAEWLGEDLAAEYLHDELQRHG